MRKRKNETGSIMLIAMVMAVIFAILGNILFTMNLANTKAQVAISQYNESYFLAEGAKEWAQFWYANAVPPYVYNGNPADDPAPITMMVDDQVISVALSDALIN